MQKDGEEKGEEPKWEKRRKGGPNWVFPNKKARERERSGWSRVWVEREDRGCKGMREIRKIIIKNKIKK